MVSPFVFSHGNERGAHLGIGEEQLRQGSGLRVSQLRIQVPTDADFITGIGSYLQPALSPQGFEMVATTDWTDFAVTVAATVTTTQVPPIESRVSPASWAAFPNRPLIQHQYLPYPCTPYFEVRQNHAVDVVDGKRCKFRLFGHDQFGNGQTEVTPWLTLTRDSTVAGAQTDVTAIGWCNKVFSKITRIQYQFEDNGAANVWDRIAFGTKFQPFQDAGTLPAGTSYVIQGSSADSKALYFNQGIALPMEVNSWTVDRTTGLSKGDGSTDILSGWLENLTTGIYYKLPPTPGKSPKLGDLSTFIGGTSIDSSDTGYSWQSSMGKFSTVLYGAPIGADPAFFENVRIPTAPQAALAGIRALGSVWSGTGGPPSNADYSWDDEFAIHLWVRTTWGRKNEGAYPVKNLP